MNVVSTPAGLTNTLGGEILTGAAARQYLKPLKREPRKKPSKRRYASRRADMKFLTHIIFAIAAGVLLMALTARNF